MFHYLLIILRDHSPEKNNLIFHRPMIGQTVNTRAEASRKETPPGSGKARKKNDSSVEKKT
jgi:hypothetical protein